MSPLNFVCLLSRRGFDGTVIDRAAAATMGLVIQVWFTVRVVVAGGRLKNERLWSGVVRLGVFKA